MLIAAWVLQKESLVLILVSFLYNSDNSYWFVNGKEIYKFKFDNENVNFATQFCLGKLLVLEKFL